MAGDVKERLHWNAAEAAHYVGFSEDTLLRWVRNAGKKRRSKKTFETPTPPFIRFGKYIRFPITEFKAWARTPTNDSQKVSA